LPTPYLKVELGSFECKTLGAGHKASVDQAFLKRHLLDDSAGQLQFRTGLEARLAEHFKAILDAMPGMPEHFIPAFPTKDTKAHATFRGLAWLTIPSTKCLVARPSESNASSLQKCPQLMFFLPKCRAQDIVRKIKSKTQFFLCLYHFVKALQRLPLYCAGFKNPTLKGEQKIYKLYVSVSIRFFIG